MSNNESINAVYFIGAGGIGMSALARFYLHEGYFVAGYDRVQSSLTRNLEKEGAHLHYKENVNSIPQECKNPKTCLVIYTPAMPVDGKEITFFRENGFKIEKRAQALATLTRPYKALCVAGTHGKTTTSAMCAHIMNNSILRCSAFLGGIVKNYGTNHIIAKSPYVVVEADEYDRSFHWLNPWISVITAVDLDHADIYKSEEAYRESFSYYTSLIKSGGALIVHEGLNIEERLQKGVRKYTYGRAKGDFRAQNVRYNEGKILFDFMSPIEEVKDVCLKYPVSVNIENATAAMAMAQLCGCTANELHQSIATFEGVERRFDVKVNGKRAALVSDYAHHPKEIEQCATSLRMMFPKRKLTVIFQPHLYSRTKDFYKEFAEALSLFDVAVICPIYPAREMPIEGVTSRLIYESMPQDAKKFLLNKKEDACCFVENNDTDVVIVLGAGDIEDYVPQLITITLAKEG